MECNGCGRWSPDDPETGYSGDLCPDCAELADMVIEDETPDPAALAEQSITSNLDTIRQALEGADINRRLELNDLLARIWRDVTTLQNHIFSEAQ